MTDVLRRRTPNGRPTGALREATRIPAPTLDVKSQGVERRVDLRADMPPVVAQAPLGSCNSCSVVAALEYFLRRQEKMTTKLSILFHYYNGRRISGSETRDEGMLTAHAMAGLMAFGVCEDKLWPYVGEKHAIEPPKQAYDAAKRFEAVQYARLPDFQQAKVLLSRGIPVTVGAQFPERFYDEAERTALMPRPTGALDGPGPGHSMLIVGYDEGDGTWLVRNSWGEQFGERGYFRIPYQTMEIYVWHENIWVVGALEKVRETKLLGGGASMESAWRETVAHAPEQHAAALERLKQDLREELSRDVEDAKEDLRRRMAPRPAPGAQQGRFGEIGGSAADDPADRLRRLKGEMRDDQQRDLDDAKKSVRNRLRRTLDDEGGQGR